MSNNDQLISYAALILADAEAPITSEALLSITEAAGASVDKYWADIFAKALEGKNVKELLFSFAASAPASAGAASSGAAAGGAATEEAAAEEVEEEKEESDDDMGFGLFD